MDIKNKNIEELKSLCQDIRDRILEVVSKNGGHLSSNIGAVEIIVAMHYVFDSKKDPFIFDVSHQSYAHKLLTNRWEEFSTLRQINGISGYTKPNESKEDYFVAGHSSTSISLAVGAAKAIKLKGEDRLPVVLIGDGSMSAGMAYEAINELGDRKYPCVIILNDNEMSISKPIGAMSKYLSQLMAGQSYQKFKARVNKLLEYAPDSAAYLAKRFEEGFKLITPGMFFEELGLEYIGPVDGHSIKSLIDSFEIAKKLNKPVIIHAQTLKGKGYEKAEGHNASWHGVGPFNIKNGEAIKKSSRKNATKIYSENLLTLASKYTNIVGVTAAMPDGTGMNLLIDKFPDRFWDVAIAEQHAVTSMAAMAKEGFKPYITIYSTFMQRAYDQVIHDCAIMNLNVVFAMDRAGIVGEDGETHQGAFDISYLNAIPNISMCAPRDEQSFKEILEYSYIHKGPLAIRYPRGSFHLEDEIASKKIAFAKSELLVDNKANISFIGYGNGVGKAYKVMQHLEDMKINLFDLVFAKPLDKEFLINLAKTSKKWYVFSDSAKKGGIGSILSTFLQENKIFDVEIVSFEYEDSFIFHGNSELVEKKLEIDVEGIVKKISNNKKY
ncbi:1-deoxyxylulose-5-phosphate synthase [Campylobacter blaseri]|uniref:1-deoxy-D-xylulose-5-phosphate synthase n=1 Tax=Campylobacter blaseri TaxID=2042961 RepID=A0A2P8R168_9BACT|nr:1-deoxy-D-xylulose-5-phosphate synthase [Campylobacter blaseri]PSM52234.1 1-deoxy-D-xylulose-5-phosphate synthase [Campylobacter blaseri]PSM54000.1 1-deoxy-D-xylulose-5-phosphate synthase [Campylobacter blaseri]QKF85438.1 1-deoxyxylulose-5-phosphate synthase [Campylobacter blaseri]